jgi:hypothetical protein
MSLHRAQFHPRGDLIKHLAPWGPLTCAFKHDVPGGLEAFSTRALAILVTFNFKEEMI